MSDPYRHHRRTLAPALAAACLALPAPAAAIPQIEPGSNHTSVVVVSPKVGDTPADYPGTGPAPAVVVSNGAKIGDPPADYPGSSPTAVVSHTAAVPAPTVTDTSSTDGFDWGSALIGAAGAAVLAALALGGVALASHRHLPLNCAARLAAVALDPWSLGRATGRGGRRRGREGLAASCLI